MVLPTEKSLEVALTQMSEERKDSKGKGSKSVLPRAPKYLDMALFTVEHTLH